MRLWIRLLLIIAVTVSMIGCGASSTTTSTSGGAETPTAGSSPTPTPIELPDFIARMQKGSQATFTATYVLVGYAVGTQVTVEQQLPKYYAASTDSNSTEIRVTDGTRQYVCESSTKTCSTPSATLSIMGFAGYYVANYWVAKMQQWPTYIPGQYNAVTITPSSTSLAGQPADCITYKNPEETDKICLFDSGVLASVQSKDITFLMTQFSPTVSPGIFAVPAGYVVTAQ